MMIVSQLKRMSALLIAAVAAISVAGQTPEYIFYFIGDGMGHGAVSLAQLYKRQVLGDNSPLTMLSLPVASVAFTHSASSPVTDSAAAGTALSTGKKTKNGMLGVTPDSVAAVSIAETLFKNGYGVGLVTTVAPDDATPAAFYAHQPHRSMFYEIGIDAAKSGYQFLAGANLRGAKGKDGEPTDLLQVLKGAGVEVVRGMDALRSAKSDRIILLNTDTVHMNDVGYAIDSLDNVLKLAPMTAACMEHLERVSPGRFFMMVEGGSIDHAAHSNDAATVAIETLDFDGALKIAYDFYMKHPDKTLIVVTADHETGGLMLGNNELYYMVRPEYLKHSLTSGVRFSEECKEMLNSGRNYTWEDMRGILNNRFGLFGAVEVKADDEARLKEKFTETFVNGNSFDKKTLYDSLNSFSTEVFGLVNRLAGIGWTSGFHTGTPVPVFAAGVGATSFGKAMDNTEIPHKIIEVAGY